MNHAAQFKLRRMTPADRTTVIQLQVPIEQLAFVDPIRDTLTREDSGRESFVLDAGDTIIGFFQIAPAQHDGIVPELLVLHEVQIDAAYQGQGFGKQFMLALLAFLAREYPQECGICPTVNCKNPEAYGLGSIQVRWLRGFRCVVSWRQIGPATHHAMRFHVATRPVTQDE